MFEIGTGSLVNIKDAKNGEIPRVSVQTTDNGILGYFEESLSNARYFENFITVNFFGISYYHPYRASVEMKVHTLKITNKNLSSSEGTFISAMINKTFSGMFNYGTQLSSSKLKNGNYTIQLPTKNGEVDFAFMESFIAELEAERIAELEAYLVASGLKDYTLTREEQKVLAEFENGKVKWSEFKIEDVFEVVGTKSLDSNAIEFTKDGINFIGRTFEDNGIQGKIQKRDFNPNTPYTITATVIGNYKYVKFQVEPYYCSQNINKLTPAADVSKWNKKVAYYFVTNIQKFVSLYDGQQAGYKLLDIKNHILQLPIQNNQPDYDKMETLISAIQKLVIKDLVLYADRKISAIKQVIATAR